MPTDASKASPIDAIIDSVGGGEGCCCCCFSFAAAAAAAAALEVLRALLLAATGEGEEAPPSGDSLLPTPNTKGAEGLAGEEADVEARSRKSTGGERAGGGCRCCCCCAC